VIPSTSLLPRGRGGVKVKEKENREEVCCKEDEAVDKLLTVIAGLFLSATSTPPYPCSLSLPEKLDIC
jgi:hypothetical protein